MSSHEPASAPFTAAASGSHSVAAHTVEGNVFTGDIHNAPVPIKLQMPMQVTASAALHNLPRPLSRQFVGRREEMALLEAAMHVGHRKTQGAMQVVSGLGGIGKSTLALHYAHKHRVEYSTTWWITAEDPESITRSLAALAAAVNSGIDTSSVPIAVMADWSLSWLQAHPGWLLIFDNAKNYGDLTYYLGRLTEGDLLITSRRADGWIDLVSDPLHLAVLSADAAVDLLTRLSKRTSPDERPAASELVHELGNLPLALEQAGAYIRRTRRTYAFYTELLRAQPARMLASWRRADESDVTIARTWRVTLDAIAVSNPGAVALLRKLAWFAPDNIPRFLIGSKDEETDSALALLAEYSMIALRDDSASVHRLVQAIARTPDASDPHRNEEAIESSRKLAIGRLLWAFPRRSAVSPKSWPRCRSLLPHVEAIINHTPPVKDDSGTGDLLFHAAEYLREQGEINAAIAYGERSHRVWERIRGRGSYDELVTRNDLAVSYVAAENFDRAISLLESAAVDSQRKLGPNSVSALTHRFNLADTYESAGDLRRAIPLLQQSVADCEKTLGSDHRLTLHSRNSLAYAYRSAGRLDLAIQLMEHILRDRERALGPEHPDTLGTRHILADTYRIAGDLDRAIPMLEQITNDRGRVLGPEHPDTLKSRSKLREAYQSRESLAP